MDAKSLCFFFAALLSSLRVSGYATGSTYRAAVVEYNPVKDGGETQRVAENVKNYKNFMSDASKKAVDIIVFPEGGLTTMETRSYIPDPAEGVIPCDSTDPKLNKVVKDLSCASKENRIYSVVNLVERRECATDDENCPQRGYYVFNTNVAFDRFGMVIARYAKYNLFDEPNTDRTQDPEMSFFDTDFGVRFGMFICFDILFSSPAQRLVQQYHITDFVFSTFWYSELPFLTALQAQRGWAEANDVNLLASGVNEPLSGSSGSGIYNGRFGHLVQLMPETRLSRLLIADVPKMQGTCSDSCRRAPIPSLFVPPPVPPTNVTLSNRADDGFKLLHDQIARYSSEVIEGGKPVEKTVCSNGFCCHFQVTMEELKPESKNYTCRAVAFNGPRRFGQNFRGGVQSCGVVMCNGPDIRNCTNRLKNIPGVFRFKQILIKGTFNRRNSFQMPSTLTDGKNLYPLPAYKYDFVRNNTEKGVEASLELLWPVSDLHSFAIWGRDFSRDGDPLEPESGAPAAVGMPILLASFLGFHLLVR